MLLAALFIVQETHWAEQSGRLEFVLFFKGIVGDPR